MTRDLASRSTKAKKNRDLWAAIFLVKPGIMEEYQVFLSKTVLRDGAPVSASSRHNIVGPFLS